MAAKSGGPVEKREPGEMKNTFLLLAIGPVIEIFETEMFYQNVTMSYLSNQNAEIYAGALPFHLAIARQHRFFKFLQPNDRLKSARQPRVCAGITER